jgi:hypothetical protein
MGEVYDLHDAEDDEETGGDYVQDSRRRYDVEDMGHHDWLPVLPRLMGSAMASLEHGAATLPAPPPTSKKAAKAVDQRPLP